MKPWWKPGASPLNAWYFDFFTGRRAEAVRVEDEGQLRPVLDLGVVDHVVGELVDQEQLLREIVARAQLREPRRGGVHLARVDAPDHLAGDLAGTDAPLRVEREAHVRLAQPPLQPRRLVEEVRAAGLDVEQQEHPVAPGGAQVAVDDPRRLARAVHAVVARVRVGDDGDELERGLHGAPGPRVGAGLAREPPRGLVGRADAEGAELLVLRRAVEGHDAAVGQQLPPAAGQLGPVRRDGRRRARAHGAARLVPRPAAAHDEGHRGHDDRGHAGKGDEPPP